MPVCPMQGLIEIPSELDSMPLNESDRAYIREQVQQRGKIAAIKGWTPLAAMAAIGIFVLTQWGEYKEFHGSTVERLKTIEGDVKEIRNDLRRTQAETNLTQAGLDAKSGNKDVAIQRISQVTQSLQQLTTNHAAAPSSFFQSAVNALKQMRSAGIGDVDTSGLSAQLAAYRSALKHHFLGTAKHVLEEAGVKDLLFFPRNVGDLRKEPASQVKMENAFEPVSLRDETATIHRCEWDDLAVITISSDALGKFIEFFDIASASADPVEKDVLIGMGYPMSSSLVFQKQRPADPVERAIVLCPTPFSGVVLPSTQGRFFKDFYSDRHVLMEYDPAKEGHHPSGISGAAVWTRHEKRKDLWSVTVEFAGVCTSCYSEGKVEQIIKASAVSRFLTGRFGTG